MQKRKKTRSNSSNKNTKNARRGNRLCIVRISSITLWVLYSQQICRFHMAWHYFDASMIMILLVGYSVRDAYFVLWCCCATYCRWFVLFFWMVFFACFVLSLIKISIFFLFFICIHKNLQNAHKTNCKAIGTVKLLCLIHRFIYT